MKKGTTILIVSLCLIVAGIAILGAAMVISGFDFENMGTDSYEEVTIPIEGNFEHIVIATNVHDIELYPAEDGISKVVGDESDALRIRVECEDGYLTVKTEDTRKWFNFIGISFGRPSLRIYLAETELVSLTAASDTGHINVPESFSFTGASAATDTGAIVFRAAITGELALASDTGSISVSKQKLEKLDCETSTGNITVESVEAADFVRAKASTGRVELHGIKCRSLDVKTSTGNIVLKNIVAENEVKAEASTGRVTLTSCVSDSLEIETSTGDVILNASDAGSIDITTDTGKVEGSLLSPKIFDTETDTGKVRVPQSAEGGICKIRTNTGNIIITVE